MEMKDIETIAKENYEKADPWPSRDVWHMHTKKVLNKKVQQYLDKQNLDETQIVLNAGCGRTTYTCNAQIIYMDIIEDYVSLFEKHLVASIENIPLCDSTIDCIVCVGSVINYADIQKSFSEFSRILKPGGMLILEFERSNSAEFLFTKDYFKTLFFKKYHYNNQMHYLWMYNEKFLLQLGFFYKLICEQKYRYHCMSSLLYRLGMSEERAAKFAVADSAIQIFSYPLAHNELVVFKKISTP